MCIYYVYIYCIFVYIYIVYMYMCIYIYKYICIFCAFVHSRRCDIMVSSKRRHIVSACIKVGGLHCMHPAPHGLNYKQKLATKLPHPLCQNTITHPTCSVTALCAAAFPMLQLRCATIFSHRSLGGKVGGSQHECLLMGCY